MTEKSKTTPPAEDATFLEAVITTAQHLYAEHGEMPPFAIMMVEHDKYANSASAIILSLPDLGGTPEQKAMAIGIVQHHCLRYNSPRSAIVAEAWGLTAASKGKEKIEAEMRSLYEEGKSIKDHPDATELVTIILESDQGQTHANLSLDRTYPEMTVLRPMNDTIFMAYENGIPPQRLSNFHVRSEDRKKPEAQAWAEKMDAIYGNPRLALEDAQNALSEDDADDNPRPTYN